MVISSSSIHFVLLPGLDGTGDLFGPLIKACSLQDKTTIVRYPNDSQLGYKELLDITYDALPVDTPFFLIAESFSGPIAINIAANNRSKILGLVLVNTFCTTPVSSLCRLLPLSILFRMSPPLAILRYYLVGNTASQELLTQLKETLKKVDPPVLARRLRDIMTVDVRDSLMKVGSPILYLRGKNDRLVSRRSIEEIRKIKPDVMYMEIDGPHLLLQAAPDSAGAALNDWIKHETAIGKFVPK